MNHGKKTDGKCREITHYRVLTLPQPKGAGDSIYFLLKEDNTVEQWLTDIYGNYKLVTSTIDTNAQIHIYNYELASPDGVSTIFNLPESFKPGSLVVRMNGLTMRLITDYIEWNSSTQIKILYTPQSTEHIHIDYIKL